MEEAQPDLTIAESLEVDDPKEEEDEKPRNWDLPIVVLLLVGGAVATLVSYTVADRRNGRWRHPNSTGTLAYRFVV